MNNFGKLLFLGKHFLFGLKLLSDSLAICIILFGLTACFNSNQNKIPEDLLQRIHFYYELEKDNRWDAAFDVRSKEYREAFERNYYVSTMQKDNKGWQLNDFNITHAKISANNAILTIEFQETPPELYRKTHNFPETLRKIITSDQSVWVKENGVWYCSNAGKRLHLTLNGSIN